MVTCQGSARTNDFPVETTSTLGARDLVGTYQSGVRLIARDSVYTSIPKYCGSRNKLIIFVYCINIKMAGVDPFDSTGGPLHAISGFGKERRVLIGHGDLPRFTGHVPADSRQ